MGKKIAAAVAGSVLVFGAAACGSDDDTDTDTDIDSPVESVIDSELAPIETMLEEPVTT